MRFAAILNLLVQLDQWDDQADPQTLGPILSDALGDEGHPEEIQARGLRIVFRNNEHEGWIGTWNHFSRHNTLTDARREDRSRLMRLLTLPCRCNKAPDCAGCQGRGFLLRSFESY